MIFIANISQTIKNRALYHASVLKYVAAKIHSFFWWKRFILWAPTVCVACESTFTILKYIVLLCRYWMCTVYNSKLYTKVQWFWSCLAKLRILRWKGVLVPNVNPRHIYKMIFNIFFKAILAPVNYRVSLEAVIRLTFSSIRFSKSIQKRIFVVWN
jgi:hypothetical protein